MSYIELKNTIMDIIQNLQGQDIIYLNVQKKISIIDAMIICTGKSNRHVVSIAEEILKKFRKIGFFYRIEGMNTGEWVLVDAGDIIIHIMQQETRKFYELEKLWR